MNYVLVAPHEWSKKGWRFWLCRHCLAPRSEHPTTKLIASRAVSDNVYISKRVWRRGQVN